MFNYQRKVPGKSRIESVWCMQAEVADKEAALKQVRQWLDQAQGQLQNTQTALNVKEKECRSLETQLEQQKEIAATLQVLCHTSC